MAERKQVAVAVAAILNDANQILIAKRPSDKHQGGKWEFPGGKIEACETTPEALVRELKEELGVVCAVEHMTALIDISFDYPDKSVRLDTWVVRLDAEQAQTAHGAEGQPVEWVSAQALAEYEFPQANVAIVDALLKQLG